MMKTLSVISAVLVSSALVVSGVPLSAYAAPSVVAAPVALADDEPTDPPVDPPVDPPADPVPFDAVTSPTVSGLAVVDGTLTASVAAWSPAADFTYQWYSGGSEIVGATLPQYSPTPTDVGQTLTVTVSGTAEGRIADSRTSLATKPVVLATQVLSVPKISGSVKVGRTLTAVVAATTPGAALEYQWYVNGKAVTGAVDETFTLSSGRLGKRITVRVIARLDGYKALAKMSAKSGVVGKGTLQKERPVLDNTNPEITQAVCATVGTWTAGTKLKYQWYLNGSRIAGATKSCIRITKASWKNKRLVLKVTGSKAGYVTASISSAATAKIYVPGRTDPVSLWNCPSWAPIKGNASSMIYHMPGQRFYKKTQPEDCFSTEAAARAAGYRKAKV